MTAPTPTPILESCRKLSDWVETVDDPSGRVDVLAALVEHLAAAIDGPADDRSTTDLRALGTLSRSLVDTLDKLADLGTALEEHWERQARLEELDADLDAEVYEHPALVSR